MESKKAKGKADDDAAASVIKTPAELVKAIREGISAEKPAPVSEAKKKLIAKQCSTPKKRRDTADRLEREILHTELTLRRYASTVARGASSAFTELASLRNQLALVSRDGDVPKAKPKPKKKAAPKAEASDGDTDQDSDGEEKKRPAEAPAAEDSPKKKQRQDDGLKR